MQQVEQAAPDHLGDATAMLQDSSPSTLTSPANRLPGQGAVGVPLTRRVRPDIAMDVDLN